MDGYVVIGTDIDTKQFDAQIQYIEKRMEEIEYKLKQADMGFEVGDTSKLEAEYEKLGNQLTSLKLKQNEVNSQGYDRLKATVSEISAGHSNVLKKIAHWGFAIFGIRTAYTGIRQVINGVLSQNEGLKNQMDGLKNSLYAAFTPIVEKIVNLIRTLMAYINYLWKGLFGKDLFKSTSKSLASGAKSAKEINRQLAGFDEANVLSSNKSSGGGASGGGTTDLKLADVPIPGWLKWIREFIEKHPTISKIIFGVAAFTLFGGWKIAGGIFGAISSLLGGGAGVGATGLLGVLGTLTLIAGTVWVVKITYDKVKEAVKTYKELKEATKQSIETTKASMEASKEKVSQVLEETAALDKNSDQHKRNLDYVYKMIDINDTYAQSTFNNRKNQEIAEKGYQDMLRNTVTEVTNLYNAGQLTEEEQYNYYKFLKTYLTPEQINNAEQLGLTAQEAYHLRDGFKDLDKKYKTQYEADMKPAKDAFDSFINQTKNSLQKPIQLKLTANLDILTEKVKKALSTYHADGGIVNLPGRGVPITHYAGEAGREGIIPMDNESQMALLGSEIAKRVTINLTNITEMNARTISRELKQINGESSFLSNS